MSRSLTHYFSPNPVKKPIYEEESKHYAARDDEDFVVAEKKTKIKNVKKINGNNEDKFDLDTDEIIPPQNGNSIKRYFARADKTTKKNKVNDCILTVQALIHGSPKKNFPKAKSREKQGKGKRSKKTTGIPSCQADLIEVVSEETLLKKITKPNINSQSSNNNVSDSVEVPEKISNKGSKISTENSDDFEDNGRRYSARLKNKPVAKPLYCDNEEECKIQKKNKPKKNNTNLPPIEDEIEILAEEVAPVFLRKKKQEETRAVKKARQDFLQSGIPELLKQQTAIRSALEQRDVEIFPRISHVTQLETKVTGSSSNFNFLASLIKPLICRQLPKRAMFDAKINKSFETTVQPLQNHPSNGQNLEWHQCKEWIHHLKHARKINFPFFRTLRAMLSKERNTDEYLWSDVCATTQWIDSLANHGSVQQLQQWLKRWKLRAGEDVDPSPKRRKTRKNVKRKRADFESSEDDMDVTDTVESSDSGSNSDQLCHAMLIVGPPGCGKTASVYALAEELGFNVLEVNASSKRNGKSVLSQLHEATQSHTLNNGACNNVNKFFGQAAAKVEEPQTALSLVLFEDVDIVFNPEDESFYSALSTLMNNSKRPIILTLTTTQESAVMRVTDKISSYFEVLRYTSPELYMTCGLLWTFSVVEGYPIDWDVLESFVTSRRTAVDYFDLRCLLMELQFRLYHHPLRMNLKFDNLQLKNEVMSNETEKIPSTVSKNSKTSNYVRFIDLPLQSYPGEWPFSEIRKRPRFIQSKDGIVQNTKEDDGDAVTSDLVPTSSRDLDCLSNGLEFRVKYDLFKSFRTSSEMSPSEASIMEEVEELMVNHATQCWTSALNRNRIVATVQSRSELVMPSSDQLLLENCVPQRCHLERSAMLDDVLPFARSMCRLDMMNSSGKRRRKPVRQTVRLATLDVALPTNVVLDIANSL